MSPATTANKSPYAGTVFNERQYAALNAVVERHTVAGTPLNHVGLVGIRLKDLISPPHGYRLKDTDVVVLRMYDNPDPSRTALRLSLGPGVTWWKGVEVVNDAYQRLGMIECHDGKRVSDTMELESEDVVP